MTNRQALVVVGGLILLFALIASRKTAPRDNAENSSSKSAACRFALASLNGDEEIAQQQTLIRNGSTAGLERLGWMFVKKARLTFDASYYNLAEQCAQCMKANGAKGRTHSC